MKKAIIIGIAGAAILAGIGIYESKKSINAPADNKSVVDNIKVVGPDRNATTTGPVITNFEECMAAGKVVVGEKPNRRCIVNDDLAYIEIQTCEAAGGEKMNFFEAQKAFDASPCGLEGSAKDNFQCDSKTGSWIIGIQTYRKDCDPVCRIDVKTGKGQVDWQCKNK